MSGKHISPQAVQASNLLDGLLLLAVARWTSIVDVNTMHPLSQICSSYSTTERKSPGLVKCEDVESTNVKTSKCLVKWFNAEVIRSSPENVDTVTSTWESSSLDIISNGSSQSIERPLSFQLFARLPGIKYPHEIVKGGQVRNQESILRQNTTHTFFLRIKPHKNEMIFVITMSLSSQIYEYLINLCILISSCTEHMYGWPYRGLYVEWRFEFQFHEFLHELYARLIHLN